MRPYNKKSGTFGSVPIARTVYQGGKGAWEVSGRWSTIDLSDGLVEGGEMDIASLGVEGTSSGLNSRVILLLE